MSKAPKVLCPKEKKRVPIWYCLGSYMQQREPCPYLIEAEVSFAKNEAKVKCGWKDEKIGKGEA